MQVHRDLMKDFHQKVRAYDFSDVKKLFDSLNLNPGRDDPYGSPGA
jgi:hypothetical protein